MNAMNNDFLEFLDSFFVNDASPEQTEHINTMLAYQAIFPDDMPQAPNEYLGYSVPDADRTAAYKWGIENKSHWWEYPDLNPRLLPQPYTGPDDVRI